MSRPQLSPGTVIDGRFTVGPAVRTREGATVYDGTDAQTGPCSLTIYDASCFPSGLVLERSLRELRQMMSVVSPRVVTVHAAGKWGDGIYEATDRLPPHTLADTLAGGPLSLRDAAGLIVQVGEALLEAQRAGVIHRDLGGDVVFPSPDGVKVSGFAVGEPQGPGSFGSLSSIAPEQVEGKVVDQRTLIYNVAALMHWMLAGSPLFAGDRDAVLGQHATGDPPSSVHAKLRRALGKDPRMRPMMLKQFLGELASLGGVEPPRATVAPIAPTRAPVAGVAPSVAAKPPTPVAPTPVAPTAPYGGGPAAPAAKPSSRGWTMFMKAQDDDIGASPEPEPASAPPPSGPGGSRSSGPGAPAPPSAGEVSPSTRGWTMFMKEEDAAQPRDPDATPRPAEAAPPAPDPATGDKPSTRGWTMFMKSQDEEAAAAAAADPAGGAPSIPADPGEAKPSTRGWTMFMKEGEEGEAKPQTPAVAPPAPASAAAVVSRADLPTAPVPTPSAPEGLEPSRGVATGPSNEPTTRGWTMFMNENQPAEAKPPMAEPVPAPAPTSAEDASGPVGPSTRGWTMFSDPAATAAPAPPTATQKGRTEMATAPLSRPKQTQQVEAATTDSGELAQKKRGWTMFMDAPIADLAQKAPPAPAEAEAEPEPPAVGASDKKGWTVFGEPSPLAAGASVPEPTPARPDPSRLPAPDVASVAVKGTEAPERGRTVMYTGTGPAPLAGPSPGPSTRTGTAPGPGAADIPPPPPSAAELARAAAEGYAGQIDDRPAKTVIAQGMSTEAGPGGSLTGRTTGAGPANQPDTMYFKRGQTEPEKPVSSRAPTARDIEPPASLRPVEERAPRAAGAHPPAEPRAMKTPETGGGGSKVLYIVLGVVVVGGLATAAFFAFT